MQKVHTLSPDEALHHLRVDRHNGLSFEEVKRRKSIYGINQLSLKKGPNFFVRFLLQFHQPLVYVLLLSTVVTLLIGKYVEAGAIFSVIFINALLGFIQDTKAERAIHALAKLTVTQVSVLRAGKKLQLPSKQLVPGDIVFLQSGDKVCADVRLLHARDLQVDEASLTGESLPIHKHIDPLPLETAVADRKNCAYAGTFVCYGQATGVVFATGNTTQTGHIAALISQTVDLATPLTRKIAQFASVLLKAILVLTIVAFIVGVLHGESLVEMLMAAIALSVSLIPEGLPAAVTIILAVGVTRMAKRKVIIRKMPTVETLGCTSVICTDKTGTLTKNQMMVQMILSGNRRYFVTGSGYDLNGQILLDEQPLRLHSNVALEETLRAGLLCNDSQVIISGKKIKIQGDPTEGALIIAARKGHLLDAELHEAHPRIDSIPFESQYQFMATLHRSHHKNSSLIYKKGSVERIVKSCSKMLIADGEIVDIDKEAILRASEQMASSGLRVLAFAKKQMPGKMVKLEHHHVEEQLIFLGLQAMIDPPRPEVIKAIKNCHTAGIEVKMITGDHINTAKAVAKQIGLDTDNKIALLGSELQKLSGEKLQEAVSSASVFARVVPEQKLRIVEALQIKGAIIAMTGDGVNDAPALKQANIGIAMGINGTEVAKNASDMLITDDNFASIEAAVEEGRAVFANLTKYLIWMLPTSLGAALLLLVAIFKGSTLPALPEHFLWINTMTALLLGTTLIFEPKEKDLMQKPPRDPKQPILTFELLMRTGLVSCIMLIISYGLFLWSQECTGATIEVSRTIVVNSLVVVQMFYLLNCRSLTGSVFSVGLFSNPLVYAGIIAMGIVQLLFTYLPLMNWMFETRPITLEAWIYIVGLSLAGSLIVALEKSIRSFFQSKAKG